MLNNINGIKTKIDITFRVVFLLIAKYKMLVATNINPITKFEYIPLSLIPLNDNIIKIRNMNMKHVTIRSIYFSVFRYLLLVNSGI